MSSLTIGRLARESGVNLQTVRYYERQRLLAPAARTQAGYRIFSPETVRQIRFIKRAQELGFSLGEIKDLLSLRAGDHSTCGDIRTRAQSKLTDVEQKIRHLNANGHIHMACLHCGKITEFTSEIFDSLKSQMEHDCQFHIVVACLEIGGYCSKCRT